MFDANDLRTVIDRVNKAGNRPDPFDIGVLTSATEECIRLTEQVNELLRYLRLSKFNHPDHWVNVDDIFLRLNA